MKVPTTAVIVLVFTSLSIGIVSTASLNVTLSFGVGALMGLLTARALYLFDGGPP